MNTDQTTEEQRSSPRPTVSDIDKQARHIIQQRPVVAVLTAAAVGYLVARLVSRI